MLCAQTLIQQGVKPKAGADHPVATPVRAASGRKHLRDNGVTKPKALFTPTKSPEHKKTKHEIEEVPDRKTLLVIN